MVDPPPQDLTALLRRLEDGDPEASSDLYSLVEAELHRLASSFMRDQPRQHTLQTTALVNEAWLRLAGDSRRVWEGRLHFFRTAARAMRTVLVDHARRKTASKRSSGGKRLPLDAVLASYEEKRIDVVAMNEALEKLEDLDPDLVRLVDLRFFAGLNMQETADLLDHSVPTAERRWRSARALLRLHLAPEETHGG
jgi:RNA polymerase sigma factor (TIGR02999 family)